MSDSKKAVCASVCACACASMTSGEVIAFPWSVLFVGEDTPRLKGRREKTRSNQGLF